MLNDYNTSLKYYKAFLEKHNLEEDQFIDNLLYGDGIILAIDSREFNHLGDIRKHIIKAIKKSGINADNKFLVSMLFQNNNLIKFYYEGYHNSLTYKDYFKV